MIDDDNIVSWTSTEFCSSLEDTVLNGYEDDFIQILSDLLDQCILDESEDENERKVIFNFLFDLSIIYLTKLYMIQVVSNFRF